MNTFASSAGGTTVLFPHVLSVNLLHTNLQWEMAFYQGAFSYSSNLKKQTVLLLSWQLWWFPGKKSSNWTINWICSSETPFSPLEKKKSAFPLLKVCSIESIITYIWISSLIFKMNVMWVFGGWMTFFFLAGQFKGPALEFQWHLTSDLFNINVN